MSESDRGSQTDSRARRTWRGIRRVAVRAGRELAWYTVMLVRRIRRDQAPVRAAGLAFGILLCSIPWMLLLISASGFFLSTADSMEFVQTNLVRMIPIPGFEDQIGDEIDARLRDVVAYRQTSGIVGVLGVLWISTFLFGMARDTLSAVFHARGRGRGQVLIGKLRDLRVLAIMGVLFVLSVSAGAALYGMRRFVRTVADGFFDIPWLRGVGPILTGIALVWILFLALYRFLPMRRIEWDTLVLSATVATAAWEIARVAFGVYISEITNVTLVFGAVGFFAALALWLYYLCIVFVCAAIVGQLYRERRGRH